MFSSLTLAANNVFLQPVTRASMTLEFQRAWTMAMRRLDPNWYMRRIDSGGGKGGWGY